MPYDPRALSEDQKSNAYVQVWVGFAASVAMLASNILPLGATIEGFSALLVGAHILTFSFYNRFDEHFVALAGFGCKCGMAVVGGWLALQGLLTVYEGAYAAGVTAGGAPSVPGDFTFRLPDWFNRAFLVASLAATAFYAGFAFAFARGR